MFKSRLRFLSLQLALLLSGVNAFAESSCGDLLEVSTKYRQNREKIKTWSGQVETIVYKGDEASPDRTIEAAHSIDFLWSASPEASLWISKQSSPQTIGIGSHPVVFSDIQDSGIITPDRVILRIISNEHRLKTGTTISDRVDSTPLPNHNRFIPTRLLNMHNGEQPVDDFIRVYCEAIQEHGEVISVNRDEDIVSLVVGGSDSDSKYQFDLSQGGNVINQENVFHTTSQQVLIDWVYTDIDDAHIPVYKETRNLRNGAVERVEVIRALQTRINQPLAEDAFSLGAIGTEIGETVFDRILKTSYIYGQ